MREKLEGLEIVKKKTGEQIAIDVYVTKIRGVEHLALVCPKCKFSFAIPLTVLNVLKQRPAGVV